MAYAAIDCLEDAVDAAREFLLPVDRGRWLRMAAIVFFLSGGAGTGTLPSITGQISFFGGDTEFEMGPIFQQGEFTLPPISDRVWLLIAVVVTVLVVLGLAFVLLGSIMEFVLIEALRSDTVRVRAPFRRYARAGLSLFAFRVALGLVVLAPLALAGLTLLAPLLDGGVSAGWLVGSIALFGLLAALLGLVAALVHGLTVEFVVPVMVAAECGILQAWRRFWPTLTDNLGQVAVYVLVRWGVAIAVSVVAGTVTGIVGAIVIVPLALIGGGVFFATGVSPLAIATLVGLVVVAVVALIAIATAVNIPLKTFTRYYELLVLGDLASEFDLVPERRAAVRDEG